MKKIKSEFGYINGEAKMLVLYNSKSDKGSVRYYTNSHPEDNLRNVELTKKGEFFSIKADKVVWRFTLEKIFNKDKIAKVRPAYIRKWKKYILFGKPIQFLLGWYVLKDTKKFKLKTNKIKIVDLL